jgi:hypothetical protein
MLKLEYMKKKEPEYFKPHLNPTYEYIQVNNEKIRVKIFRNEEFSFTLDFYYNGGIYQHVIPKISSNYHIFGRDDISFEGINLNVLEKEKLAKRLNQILNSLFD